MRRFAWIMIALAMLAVGTARAEGPVCVCTRGVACLVDENGETLLEGDGIEDLFPVRQGALYAAGKNGAYRLYDALGNPVGDSSFGMIDDAGECLIFRQGSLYGAMDASGAEILPAAWTQLVSDGEGGFLALDTDPLDETPDELLRVDARGGVTPTGVYTSGALPRLQGGLMRVSANGRSGAVEAGGRLVVPVQWLGLDAAFAGGFAVATGEHGTGMIDATGAEVIPTVYDWLARGDGIVAALNGTGVDVFSEDGSVLIYSVAGENLEASVAGNRLLVRDGDAARLYDDSGAVIGEYGPAFACAPGLDGQLIAWEGGWGEARAWLMNPDGSAASGRYQHILPLAGGRYAFAVMKGTQYHSAELDRIQTSWDYDSLRFGLMDEKGTQLLPAEFREIRALSDDRLLLVSDDGIRLTDLDGHAVRSWITAETEAPTVE